MCVCVCVCVCVWCVCMCVCVCVCVVSVCLSVYLPVSLSVSVQVCVACVRTSRSKREFLLLMQNTICQTLLFSLWDLVHEAVTWTHHTGEIHTKRSPY